MAVTSAVRDTIRRLFHACIAAAALAACHRQAERGASQPAAQAAPTSPVPAASSPVIPSAAMEIKVVPPNDGWELGRVSWVETDRNGLVYLIQRGDRADPVVVVNREGRVLRSWGKGMYVMPHSIRIDPEGYVWTTDAKSSHVIKFTPDGREMMTIAVGGQPADCAREFCGTTDIAFGPNGHLYITDGYANARVLEYTADGRKAASSASTSTAAISGNGRPTGTRTRWSSSPGRCGSTCCGFRGRPTGSPRSSRPTRGPAAPRGTRS